MVRMTPSRPKLSSLASLPRVRFSKFVKSRNCMGMAGLGSRWRGISGRRLRALASSALAHIVAEARPMNIKPPVPSRSSKNLATSGTRPSSPLSREPGVTQAGNLIGQGSYAAFNSGSTREAGGTSDKLEKASFGRRDMLDWELPPTSAPHAASAHVPKPRGCTTSAHSPRCSAVNSTMQFP